MRSPYSRSSLYDQVFTRRVSSSTNYFRPVIYHDSGSYCGTLSVRKLFTLGFHLNAVSGFGSTDIHQSLCILRMRHKQKRRTHTGKLRSEKSPYLGPCSFNVMNFLFGRFCTCGPIAESSLNTAKSLDVSEGRCFVVFTCSSRPDDGGGGEGR